jgi:nickel/cobalt transporter (NiCoT) family protein
MRLVPLAALLLTCNIVAWLWAWSALGSRPDLLALAFLAWTFGLRHAVDADHIAAIDNAVRKLMQGGQRPMRVGLYFSLGHSTVVVLASIGIAAAAGGMRTWMDDAKPLAGFIGTTVSAAFLLVIALINLNILLSLWRQYRLVARGGVSDHEALDSLLNGRGFLSRVLRPVMRLVSRSWHLYPVGFLFGLGFDTATEVGLLGIAATQAAQGLPTWYILVFPALFTAGMTLVDTADGVLMVRAYAWAVAHPLRRLTYNLTVTAVSVCVALVIGGIEVLGLIADHAGFDAPFWARIALLNDALGNIGVAVIALFLVIWGAYAVLYRWKGPDPALASERD